MLALPALADHVSVRAHGRPAEGFLHVDVDLSPMSSVAVEVSGLDFARFPATPSLNPPCPPNLPAQPNRQHPRAVELARLLERVLREARAVDVEALCIAAGDRVWDVRTHVTVLDDAGSLADVCVLAAVACLRHFRRADVGVEGGSVVVYGYDERAPVPLSLHHSPVCVSFALFGPSLAKIAAAGDAPEADDAKDSGAGGAAAETASAVARAAAGGVTSSGAVSAAASSSMLAVLPVADPETREEVASDGVVVAAVNAHGEVCGLHKVGGAPMTVDELMACTGAAIDQGKGLCEALDAALKRAEAEQQRLDTRKHAAAQRVEGMPTLAVEAALAAERAEGPAALPRSEGPSSGPYAGVRDALLQRSVARMRAGEGAAGLASSVWGASPAASAADAEDGAWARRSVEAAKPAPASADRDQDADEDEDDDDAGLLDQLTAAAPGAQAAGEADEPAVGAKSAVAPAPSPKASKKKRKGKSKKGMAGVI
ncbi:exosc9 [Symbiodinium sp. KB8]|nr:exosc9 [Symbiodinium sp. KB8]